MFLTRVGDCVERIRLPVAEGPIPPSAFNLNDAVLGSLRLEEGCA